MSPADRNLALIAQRRQSADHRKNFPEGGSAMLSEATSSRCIKNVMCSSPLRRPENRRRSSTGSGPGFLFSQNPTVQKRTRADMESTAYPNPIAKLAAAISLHRQLAGHARANLEAATPMIVAAIRHQSGQSRKVEAILWSAWNGDLCDMLAGLDSNLADAVIQMIAARAHMAGEADDMLRRIIQQSGSQPPTTL